MTPFQGPGSNAFLFQRVDAALIATSRTDSMQNISTRTNHTPPDQPENTNVKPVAEIEGALRDFVRRDVRSASGKDMSDVAANVDSLVQRATSLGELHNVIEELEQLHEFLHSEGQRLEQEISEYAQLSKSTVSATRLIADNMLHWKKTEPKKP
jgi:hypothetical protein